MARSPFENVGQFYGHTYHICRLRWKARWKYDLDIEKFPGDEKELVGFIKLWESKLPLRLYCGGAVVVVVLEGIGPMDSLYGGGDVSGMEGRGAFAVVPLNELPNTWSKVWAGSGGNGAFDFSADFEIFSKLDFWSARSKGGVLHKYA